MNTMILLGIIFFAVLALARNQRGLPKQTFGSKPHGHADHDQLRDQQKSLDESLQQAHDSLNPLIPGSAAWNAEQARKMHESNWL